LACPWPQARCLSGLTVPGGAFVVGEGALPLRREVSADRWPFGESVGSALARAGGGFPAAAVAVAYGTAERGLASRPRACDDPSTPRTPSHDGAWPWARSRSLSKPGHERRRPPAGRRGRAATCCAGPPGRPACPTPRAPPPAPRRTAGIQVTVQLPGAAEGPGQARAAVVEPVVAVVGVGAGGALADLIEQVLQVPPLRALVRSAREAPGERRQAIRGR
jgi:hypothetical protein